MTRTAPRTTWLYFTALVLPLVALAALAGVHAWQSATSRIYTVVVEGFDPRDMVYGEYLEFRPLWDHPDSQKPENADRLPERARMYLPEGNAWDLQSMLWAGRHRFTADILVAGTNLRIKNLSIDGRPWRKGLERWRADKSSAAPPQPPSQP